MTKKIVSFLLLGMSLFSFSLSPITVRSAEYVSGDSPSVNENKTSNLYISGGTVSVNSNLDKDLVAAGGTLNITGQVGRNILAAGGTVIVDSRNVGGATRIAGGTVTLRGTFNDDVLITAGTLKLENAKINGDLTVAVGELDVQSSQISGNLNGTYANSQGDLTAQTQGKVDLKRQEQKNDDQTKFAAAGLSFAWEFSVIVGLLLLSFVLGRRRILAVPGVRFDLNFVIDLLGGIGYLVLPVLVFLLSLLLQLYPLVSLLWTLIGVMFILSAVYFPIYLANLVRNSFNSKANIAYFIVGSYVVLLLFKLLNLLNPFLGLFQLIVFFFYLANFGYLMRHIWKALNRDLHTPEDLKASLE